MKALTLWQPWASLVAIGAKPIETRSWATRYRGPLLIHAAQRPPAVPDLHGWIGRYNLGAWADPVQHAEPCDCDHDEEQLGARCAKASHAQHALLNDEGAHGFSLATVLPLGAVVATCALADVVPMVAAGPATRAEAEAVRQHGAVVVGSDRAALYRRGIEPGEVSVDRTGQLPYGDFQPGRWAWLLEDVRPLPEPVPCPGRQGLWEPNDALLALLP